jgi:hypothetical protein
MKISIRSVYREPDHLIIRLGPAAKGNNSRSLSIPTDRCRWAAESLAGGGWTDLQTRHLGHTLGYTMVRILSVRNSNSEFPSTKTPTNRIVKANNRKNKRTIDL